MEIGLLLLAALLAGFVDAVAGGGGLIQVPALLAGLPAASPATVFGTNKIASVFGTANATWRYARRIPVPWALALPAAGAAFVSSFIGAACVAWLPKDVARPLVLVLLVVVTTYTIFKRDMGRVARHPPKRPLPASLLLGVVLGFYDGFFGPGAGSFLLFAFVRFFGLDFLRASSAAKIVNLATNAAALCFFIPHGDVLWPLGLGMACFNIVGATLGTRMAVRHGSGFVRWVFLLVAATLIVKFGYDTLLAAGLSGPL